MKALIARRVILILACLGVSVYWYLDVSLGFVIALGLRPILIGLLAVHFWSKANRLRRICLTMGLATLSVVLATLVYSLQTSFRYILGDPETKAITQLLILWTIFWSILVAEFFTSIQRKRWRPRPEETLTENLE